MQSVLLKQHKNSARMQIKGNCVQSIDFLNLFNTGIGK